MKLTILLGAAIAVGLVSPVSAAQPLLGGKAPVKVQKRNGVDILRYADFAYGKRANRPGEGGFAHHGTGQLFDVYTRAKPSGKKPIMISLHGGAWSSASDKDGPKGANPAEAFGGLEAEFAAQGDFMVFKMNYLLQPENCAAGNVSADATFVNMLKDIDAMVSHLKTFLTENGVEVPAKIALHGTSAGAQLAVLYAYDGANPSVLKLGLKHEIPVGFVLDVVGPVDLSTLVPKDLADKRYQAGKGLLRGLTGLPKSADEKRVLAALKALDATALVNDKTPFTIGVYAETAKGSGTDGVVAFRNYENLKRALGDRFRGRAVSGATHVTCLNNPADMTWFITEAVKAKPRLEKK